MRFKSKLKYFLLVVGVVQLVLGLNGDLFKTVDLNSPSRIDYNTISSIQNDLENLSFVIDKDFRVIESTKNKLSSLDLIKPPIVSYFKLYRDELIDWDNYEYNLPSIKEGDIGKSFISYHDKNGIFLLKKLITSDEIELIALIPIYRKYSIQNEFLNDDVEKDFIGKYKTRSSFEEEVNSRAIVNKEGEILFYIADPELYNKSRSVYWLKLALTICGILVLSLSSVLFFLFFERQRKYYISFIFLTVSLLFLRWFMLESEFFSSIVEVEWFKSNYFASSFLFPSFGDFIVNLLCLLGLGFYSFLRIDETDINKRLLRSSRKKLLFVLFLLVIALNVVLYLFYWGIFILHKDAQWSFDISKSVELNYYTISYLLIFIFLSSVTFLYSYFIIRFGGVIIRKLGLSKLSLSLLFMGLLPNIWVDISWEVVTIFYLYVTAVVYFKLHSGLRDFNFRSYLFLVITAFSFSLIGSLVLIKNSNISEEVNKKTYATQILDNSDLELEYLLGEISKELKTDSIVLKTLPSIWTTKDGIISKIQNDYLGHDFERYDIGIHLFDKYGNGYFKNSIEESYFELRKKYTQIDYRTSIKNLYHLSTYSGVLRDKYIHFIQIKIGTKVVGYIVLELALKKIKANSLYPLLVNNYETNKQLLLSGYEFAVYENGKLVFNHGNYLYPEKISSKEGGVSYDENGYNHYQTKNFRSKQIVISAPKNLFAIFMANFSYLFVVLVFNVFLVLLLVSFFNQKKLTNFSTKIQIYLNLACFLPLIVVSISTMSVLNDNYKEDLNKTFINRAQSIGGNIDEYVDRYINKQIAIEELGMVLNKMSEYTLTDINLYDVTGNLLLSSQQSLFEMGLLSNLINPIAKLDLGNQKNVTLLEEQIGVFEYRSVYLDIESPNTGKHIGMISIPFFNSTKEFNSRRIAILSTYMNIFTVAFLLILLLSQVAYNSITKPLKFIADKLKRISFTGVNEELNWSTKDEIGLLVDEYNQMLHKLEESKVALSQSEKEFAWREMAQQVAHEIKNPLTPMKLSMQHMKRIGVDDPDKLRSSIDSMLSQIETLNDIASSFSSFAKMPIPESEEYDVRVVFNSIISLYDNEEVKLIYSVPDEHPILVIGDDKVMGRILTNLVINGIQAYSGKGFPEIELHMVVSSTDVLIEVKDNGVGIPEEIQSKVFMPNFSTKYTGSGIGLAVAKRGVEHAHGNIWFDTEEGRGTTFYIKLPRVFKPKD